MNEAKIKTLENKMFKLLKNKPYNVVRGQCDRIGRQIMEVDKRVVVDKSKSTSES